MIRLSKPFVDEETRKAVIAAVDSGNYILKEKCAEFEKNFATYFGTKHAIAVANGTAALFLTLHALDIKQGDEVLVPAHTAFPTIEAIFHTGATPVFVDIDEHSMTMDPKLVEKAITKKTKVILPVHLYGHPADLDPLMVLAKKHNILLVEDACQAHGALYTHKKIGSLGIAGCFSFYPSKNLTVLGDGGMIITNDDALAKHLRMLRNHGRESRYDHLEVGYNLRFNEIQAAAGIVQLKHLDRFVEQRRAHAKRYNALLANVGDLILPKECFGQHSYHLYVIRTKRRDALMAHLKEQQIETEIHYPIPMHMQPGTLKALKLSQKPCSLPVTEKITQEILSLPMHPALTEQELRIVADAIKKFYSA